MELPNSSEDVQNQKGLGTYVDGTPRGVLGQDSG